jgi:hypothetical protein
MESIRNIKEINTVISPRDHRAKCEFNDGFFISILGTTAGHESRSYVA